MAQFTEDHIQVNVVLARDAVTGQDHIFLSARSFDTARGAQVRALSRLEVTDRMTAARMTGIKNLLDDAFAFVQAQWEIPVLNAARAIDPAPGAEARTAMRAKGADRERRAPRRKRGK